MTHTIRAALAINLLLATLLGGLATTAQATEDNCTVWLWQTDGSYWRQCVRPNGTVYCQSRKGKTISVVSCRK